MTESIPYVVWSAGVSWDGIRGTDRNLVDAMSRHAHVLWVDPPVSLLRSLAHIDRSRRQLRPWLAAENDWLDRLTPVALPGLTRPFVRSTTGMLLRAQIRWAIRRLQIEPAAIVATHLDAVLGKWGDDVVDVLYGTDDYVAGARLLGLSRGWLRRREKRAIARADVVVVITEQLKDRWAGLGSDPVVIANGCSSSTSSPRAGLGVVVDLPRPVVGLVGQLSERIDMSLLEAVADAGYSLLLVGPRDQRWEASRFADLVARPNVLYAGKVPAAAVPSYLAKIDVGITPYRDSAFNRASFPLKTLEYLSAGIPVVTTDLPSARWLRANSAETLGNSAVDSALAIADNRVSFVDAITRICKRHDTVSCRRLAAQHSWSDRAELLAGVIGLPPIPSPDSPGTAIR